MKKFNVGIQLYGLRNTLAEDFFGTLKAVRDMGYEYVEFAGYHGKTSAEIKEALDSLGLKSISVHQRLDFFRDDPMGAVDFLRGFGIKYVVVPYHSRASLAGTENWKQTVDLFNSMAKLFAENGMTLGYHNHDFEYEIYEGKYLLDHIVESVPEGLIVPELDTCWVNYAGASPVDEIKKYSGRLPIVHLKDFVCTKRGGAVYDLIGTDGTVSGKRDQKSDGFEFRPLGQGVQDFASILAACEESGTETVIVEQDSVYGGMSELEAAKASRDYLKNTFGI